MERLKKDLAHIKKDGIDSSALYRRVCKYLEELARYKDAMPMERAQELAQAERDGRLVVLPPPAKEGDPAPKCFYNEAGNPWAWCLGMGRGPDDDEPSERCKACWYLETAHQEAEAAAEKEE